MTRYISCSDLCAFSLSVFCCILMCFAMERECVLYLGIAPYGNIEESDFPYPMSVCFAIMRIDSHHMESYHILVKYIAQTEDGRGVASGGESV